MLRRSFEIFRGVGPAAARKIKDAGVETWAQALSGVGDLPVGRALRETLSTEIPNAIARFDACDAVFFDPLVKPKDAWRLFSSFADRCVFFDIETTGLSPHDDDITIICTYSPFQRTFAHFIRNESLDEFPRTLSSGDILVGFNSRAFDMPFLKSCFGEQLPPIAHIDLRWVLHSMGIRGRLKDLEQEHFGIRRPSGLAGFDGEQAVLAWFQWERTRDRDILGELVRYCSADVFTLDFMIRDVCARLGCPRFKDRLPSDILFASRRQAQWAFDMPELPRRVDQSIGPVLADPLSPDDETSDGEVEYKLEFLFALIDEFISKEERLVLDLFATHHGLSRRRQEELEHEARVQYDSEGLSGVKRLALQAGAREPERHLQQLLMFSFVDGRLDERERSLIVDLARELSISKERFSDLRVDAIRRGHEIMARLK